MTKKGVAVLVEGIQKSYNKEFAEAQETLNIAKSFALIAFGMTLGALIWMWL